MFASARNVVKGCVNHTSTAQRWVEGPEPSSLEPWSPPPIVDTEGLVEPLDRAVRYVARRYRLRPSEEEDLRSDLWVRLLSNHGGILERLASAAHPTGYLTRAARNLVIDAIVARVGKRRVRRCAPSTAPVTTASYPTRRFVDAASLRGLESSEPSPFDACADAEISRQLLQLKRALVWASRELPDTDRDLLRARYVADQSVARIAAERGLDAKVLYRTYERLLRRLRLRLEAAGIDPGRATETLQHSGLDRMGKVYVYPPLGSSQAAPERG